MGRDELLTEARAAFADRRWLTASGAFREAEALEPLEPDDLDRLAVCAALLHRPDDYFATRELAFRRQLESLDRHGAAVSALWIGIQHVAMGDPALGSGWLRRATRLATSETPDDHVLGYLAIAETFAAEVTGDVGRAVDLAEQAVATAQRFDDGDLAALALHREGLVLIRAGRPGEGLRLLDEAMAVVTAGETSPMITGIVYCEVISGCWAVYDLDRADQWTTALSGWCASQPELRNFVGECRVRRAELQQLHGDWDGARSEIAGMERDADVAWAGTAVYVRGELDRLRGRYDAAERSFADAARLGHEPQPGLALLRLARGSTQAAAAMVRRSLAEVRGSGRRVAVLVAAVEVFLAVGDDDAASSAVEELDRLAARQDSDVVRALAAQARAALLLARGRPDEAGVPARAALETWLRTDVPYQQARARMLLADAARALGDVESADRERRTAREIFGLLGARPDLDALDRPARQTLSAREVEVLRLVATGATNRAIAGELYISERTVDRHVSSILTKLGVASRAAATARAAEWHLV